MGAGNVAVALNAMQDADTDKLCCGNRHERVNSRNYTRIDKTGPRALKFGSHISPKCSKVRSSATSGIIGLRKSSRSQSD